jgi:hypothetical protein
MEEHLTQQQQPQLAVNNGIAYRQTVTPDAALLG